MNERKIDLMVICFTLLAIVLLITVSKSFCMRLSHIENMARLGYQECLEDGKLLWQKECYKID